MLQVIKSNTWKTNSNVLVRKNVSGRIFEIRLTRTDANIPLAALYILAFSIMLFIPIIGWIGCYKISKSPVLKCTDNFTPDEIKKIELITQENESSLAAKLGWGLAGGALFGGAGMLAGALAKGNNQKAAALFEFSSDRRAIISGDGKEINELIMLSAKL